METPGFGAVQKCPLSHRQKKQTNRLHLFQALSLLLASQLVLFSHFLSVSLSFTVYSTCSSSLSLPLFPLPVSPSPEIPLCSAPLLVLLEPH